VNGRIRLPVMVLACAVGVVMLIVCANLSNLLLARTADARRKSRSGLRWWQYPSAFVRVVTDGYLKVMGISLISGRDISESATHPQPNRPLWLT
jgi:hypothetical protein